MRKKLCFFLGFCLVIHCVSPLHASEVIEETPTRVIVRQHPKTGAPYVSIVSSKFPTPQDPFAHLRRTYSRPDYRMLDPKIKSGQIPYNGPWSDRKKVYILAASLATLGTVGGAVGLATAPAATGTAASGGASVYLAAGTAVAGGTAGAVAVATKQNPHSDDFTQASESRVLEPDLQKK